MQRCVDRIQHNVVLVRSSVNQFFDSYHLKKGARPRKVSKAIYTNVYLQIS